MHQVLSTRALLNGLSQETQNLQEHGPLVALTHKEADSQSPTIASPIIGS